MSLVSDFPIIQSTYKPQHVREGATGLTGDWWNSKPEDIHNALLAVANAIAKDQAAREEDIRLHGQLYSGRQVQMQPGRYVRFGRRGGLLSYNAVRNCADTAAALISKNRPRPQFVPSGGNGSMKRKARLLNKYVEGVFHFGKAYAASQKAFVDACVYGTGIVKLAWSKDSNGDPCVRFERCLPWEILVDDEDGFYGEPKQIHHVRWVYPDALAHQFPKHKEAIKAAAQNRTNSSVGSRAGEKVKVVESWHLKSGHEAKDGVHVIAIEGATLYVEAYEHNDFPFSFFSWKDAGIGFWGTGIAEELIDVQREINRLCRNIQQAQHLANTPRVFIQEGSQVIPSHLANRRDNIPVVRYRGTAPTISTAPAMPPEAYQSLQSWIDRAYEVTGISQMQATAQKPAGLDSAVAQREYNDTAAARFALTGQRWEDFHMDMARKAIAMTRSLHDAGHTKLKTRAKDGGLLREIKWSDVNLDEDKYVLQVFPASQLPTTPAGKFQTVQEYAQAGYLTPEEAMELLQLPDLEGHTNLRLAALRDIELSIEDILERGQMPDADDTTNLELAVKMGLAAIAMAKREEPEDRVELLRRWVDSLKDRLDAEQPQQQPGNTDPAAAMAVPEAPPTSDLMAISDPRAKWNFDRTSNSPVAGPAEASFDVLTSGGGMDVKASAQKHGDFSTRFARNPAAGTLLTSDPDAKVDTEAASSEVADAIRAMDGGVTFHYKPETGKDPSVKHWGTTTEHLKATAIGDQLVTVDPETGYEAIDVKEGISVLLAFAANLGKRLDSLEGRSKKPQTER